MRGAETAVELGRMRTHRCSACRCAAVGSAGARDITERLPTAGGKRVSSFVRQAYALVMLLAPALPSLVSSDWRCPQKKFSLHS
jgi:hypothetical protein